MALADGQDSTASSRPFFCKLVPLMVLVLSGYSWWSRRCHELTIVNAMGQRLPVVVCLVEVLGPGEWSVDRRRETKANSTIEVQQYLQTEKHHRQSP